MKFAKFVMQVATRLRFLIQVFPSMGLEGLFGAVDCDDEIVPGVATRFEPSTDTL